MTRADLVRGAGVFGPRTERGVIDFQTEAKKTNPDVRITGVVDSLTHRLLSTPPKPPKSEASEVATDVFEKPPTLSRLAAANTSSSATVTDEDDEATPLKTG